MEQIKSQIPTVMVPTKDNDSFYHNYVIEELNYSKSFTLSPFFTLGKHWEIKLIPPYGDVDYRFLVRHKDYPEKWISILLDFNSKTGVYFNHEPFFEVYPFKGKVAKRCNINDTKKLKLLVRESLSFVNDKYGVGTRLGEKRGTYKKEKSNIGLRDE